MFGALHTCEDIFMVDGISYVSAIQFFLHVV